MTTRFINFVLAVAAAMPANAGAEEIRGTVTVKQRLTKPRVTAAPALYHRGPAVELRSDSHEDPLALERARVVIYVEGERSGGAIHAVMEQKERRFIPELLAIPAGSTVSFPNSDLIFHNVFSLSKAKSFDLGNYPKDHTRTVTFVKPGVEFVNCHLHPNMSATIVVTPNAWTAIADRDGHFVLHGVPAGTYTVVAWHKASGAIRQTVRVAPQQGAAVDFLVPLDDNASTRIEARR